VVALHVLDDSFFQPHPGTSAETIWSAGSFHWPSWSRSSGSTPGSARSTRGARVELESSASSWASRAVLPQCRPAVRGRLTGSPRFPPACSSSRSECDLVAARRVDDSSAARCFGGHCWRSLGRRGTCWLALPAPTLDASHALSSADRVLSARGRDVHDGDASASRLVLPSRDGPPSSPSRT